MRFDLETLFVGQEHLHCTDTESTNKVASNLLTSGYTAEGMVITTDYQTAGRGQIGRSWYGSPGLNIMCSIILRPKFLQARDQFQLSMVIACAVRSSISRLSPNVETYVKWPNDIYVGDKKVGGMLLQNTLSGSSISHTVVGLGININEESFPSDLPNPISLCQLTGGGVPLVDVYEEVFRDIETYYLRLKRGESASIEAEYLTHLYQRGIAAQYQDAEERLFYGIIQHVDPQGKLVMLVDGDERHFSYREVSLVI